MRSAEGSTCKFDETIFRNDLTSPWHCFCLVSAYLHSELEGWSPKEQVGSNPVHDQKHLTRGGIWTLGVSTEEPWRWSLPCSQTRVFPAFILAGSIKLSQDQGVKVIANLTLLIWALWFSCTHAATVSHRWVVRNTEMHSWTCALADEAWY